LLLYLIGPINITNTILRIYNGTEVNIEDYRLSLPENWSIMSECKQAIRIIGHKSEGFENNKFIIDMYKIALIPKKFIKKWSICDSKSFYPLTTYEGKKLAISLCTFDFNETSEEKPSLALIDKNGNLIASVYEWKPYFHNEYLDIFKRIKLNQDSSIVEFSEKD